MAAPRHPSAHTRGGKGGSEPRARLVTRRVRAWDRSIQGASQRAIAAELGVSQPAVSKMLRRTAAEILADLTEQAEVHHARHVQRVEHVVAESLAAWERSKQDRTQRRHRRLHATGTPDGAPGPPRSPRPW